jgi:hypothetical protein
MIIAEPVWLLEDRESFGRRRSRYYIGCGLLARVSFFSPPLAYRGPGFLGRLRFFLCFVLCLVWLGADRERLLLAIYQPLFL